jgi:hypothetical protein
MALYSLYGAPLWLWTKVVHYVGNRVLFGKPPRVSSTALSLSGCEQSRFLDVEVFSYAQQLSTVQLVAVQTDRKTDKQTDSVPIKAELCL